MGEEQAPRHLQYSRGARLHFGGAVDDGQALQQFRPAGGQLEADHAAHADAHQVHRRQAQVLDQRRQVGGETGDAVALARFVGLAVAAHVEGDHPVPGLQLGNLAFPVRLLEPRPWTSSTGVPSPLSS
jgi:hypothetical protein